MINSAESVVKNFFWRFAERTGAQLVQLVVSIVLARILAPTDYGTVALMTVFTSILGLFINCGMGSALIQKKDADQLDFSSVFYAQMVLCLIIYTGLFFFAPRISVFYAKPEMTTMIRVSGLTLVIAGIRNVQNAYISKTMQFKRFFFATLVGTIGAAFVGIGMAIYGFGAWALIIQNLFNTIVDTIILWVTVKWRPVKVFSFNRLKNLFSYSWKLLISSLLDTVYNNLRTLIIGKVYSSEDLAFYNKGGSWPNLIIDNINSSIDSVLLPTMSSEQDNITRVKSMTRRAIKTSTYIIAPMMMGLAACSTPLVRLILTDKWLACVLFQRIFCITYMFYPIHTANLNAIKALGRSDLFLKLEVVKKVIGVVAIIITVPMGIKAMGYSLLILSVLSQVINSSPNKKLLNYGYLEQLKDILPAIMLAVIMGCCVYTIQFLGLSDLMTLSIEIPLGIVIYILGSALLKLESFFYLWDLLKRKINKETVNE